MLDIEFDMNYNVIPVRFVDMLDFCVWKAKEQRNEMLLGFKVSMVMHLHDLGRWLWDLAYDDVACDFFQVGPVELLAVEDEMKEKMVEKGVCREVAYSH
jgi:hypothetical protein